MENRTEAAARQGILPPAMPAGGASSRTAGGPPQIPLTAPALPAGNVPAAVNRMLVYDVEEPHAKILLVAGESSGDAHAADLILSLRRKQEGLRFIGAGGPRMAAAGQHQLFDLAAYAVVGLWEIARNYFTFRRFYHQLLALARKEQPEIVILVDYPGMNLMLMEAFRKILPASRIIYYISPQVWAWKQNRAQKMAKDLDLLLVLFPFEVDWFHRHARKLRVQCVGHPLLDRLDPAALGAKVPGRVALLPGSRSAEIRRHLPIMWEAAHLLAAKRVGIEFVLLCPNEEMQQECLSIIDKLDAPGFTFEVYSSYQLTHLARCELAMAKSGTSSLECAFVGVVPVIVYKVHPLTYEVAKRVITLPHVGMINLLAKEEIVPELLQNDFTSRNLAQTTWRILRKPRILQETRQAMAEVIAGTLGGPGASDRAADAVLRELAAQQAQH